MAYILTDEFVWKEIGQQVVVLQFETGAYWTLNDTASFIWKSIVEGCSADEAAERLSVEFDVSKESAQADIQEFLKDCIDKKMLIPGSSNVMTGTS